MGDISELTNLVSNNLFPIVACFMLFIQQKEMNKTLTELTSTLKTIDNRISNLEKEK